MKKQISRGTAVALCLLSAIAACNVTILACREQFNAAMPNAAAQKLYAKLGEIQGAVEHNYVGEYDQEEMVDMAATGLVVGVGDRWSSYLTRAQYETYKLDFAGKLVGIGITITQNKEGKVLITDVYDNSPAQAAGLVPHDELIGAGDKTIEADGYDAVVDAVRGEAGTAASVTIRKDGETVPKTIEIKRAKVDKTAVRARMLPDHIGYIAIHDFDGGADVQFKAALKQMQEQGAEKLVLDVRWNPGGSVIVLKDMLDPLLPEGPIITLEPKNGEKTTYSSDAAALEMPMAVLVNAESISAAEFFAAALQEYDKAVVVGDQTIGKGYSQKPYVLSDGSALILSDQKYYTPKNKNLAGIGIVPDVSVSLSDEAQANHYFLTEKEDTQLQAAIEALS